MADENTTADGAPVDLGPLLSYVGFVLRRAQLAMQQDLLAALAAEGMREGQFAVLAVLGANPGARQARIAGALCMKTTNFVPLFDGLEQRGLAERRAMPGDRRAKGLYLTEAGTAMLARLVALRDAHEARFNARIGPEGRQHLLALLQRLSDPAYD